MKMWVGLAVLMTLGFSSVAVLRGAEQEDMSGPPGMSVTPDTQGKRVTGQLTHIRRVALHDKGFQRGRSQLWGKEGDHIVAVIREDRIALSIKNMKKKSGPQG